MKRPVESPFPKPVADRRQVSIPQGGSAGGGLPSPTPAASVNPLLGLELPLLDTDTFDRWSVLLAREKIAGYLDTLIEFSEANLTGLQLSYSSASEGGTLGDSAHKLAGGAGMFGLRRVEGLSRCYERALETGDADIETIANSLRVAITVTHAEIERRLRLGANR